MKKFEQLTIVALMSGMTEQAVQAQTHYYEYLHTITNENVKVVNSVLVETYSPFQFSFDESRKKCFLTDAKGVFPYSYVGIENEMSVYIEDKPGYCGYRTLFFSTDYTFLNWDCPEDYIPTVEKKSLRILHRIEKD